MVARQMSKADHGGEAGMRQRGFPDFAGTSKNCPALMFKNASNGAPLRPRHSLECDICRSSLRLQGRHFAAP